MSPQEMGAQDKTCETCAFYSKRVPTELRGRGLYAVCNHPCVAFFEPRVERRSGNCGEKGENYKATGTQP